MIRLDCDQGSAAWFAARLGLPTASQFDRVLTPKTMKPSAAAEGYRHELLAEYLLGEPLESGDADFMARGTAMEDDARRWYEMLRDVEVDRVGFLLRDDRRCGGSPDGLIGTAGGLEIKCPSAGVHVGYLLGNPAEKYKAQIQGNLWIAEREWWDFLSYHPTLPPALVRVTRDEPFIAALAGAMTDFCDALEAGKAELAARGYEPRPPQPTGYVPEAQPFYMGVG